MKLLTVSSMLLGLVLGLSPANAKKVTVCVSDCPFTSIQQAVDAAAPGDTVWINTEGVISESGILISKNLTLIGRGQAATIIQPDGRGSGRIFHITGGASVRLEQLSIRDAAGSQLEGGILVDGHYTSLTMNAVTVRDFREAGSGAAVHMVGAFTSLNLDGCFFDSNAASNGGGGALFLDATSGDILARNTQFKTNKAAGGSGGAAYVGEGITATFINCHFTGNKALNGHSGGAVFASGAVPTFNNCLFSGNAADNQGGALRIGGANIANCSFVYNSAQYGGAISRGTAAATNPLYIDNCTILNNAATGFVPVGAGLHNESPVAPVHMMNTVISKSTAGSDMYLNAASTLGTNQKNQVGRARSASGLIRFASN